MKFPDTKHFTGDKPLAIELLKGAKKVIEAIPKKALCFALGDAATHKILAGDYQGVRQAEHDLRYWISHEILAQNYVYVVATAEFIESFRKAHPNEPLAEIGYPLSRASSEVMTSFMASYRLAWADHLISYLESQP